jgi:hypothetical protein
VKILVAMIMIMMGIIVANSFIKGKKEAEQNLIKKKDTEE